MLILGIETSCDETSAAIVEDGWRVRSCTIASSRKDFERMGGVVPEDAARKQLESILPTIEDAMKEAGIRSDELDAIAVTRGPGLLGSLLVGTTTAHVLSALWKKPLLAVHHTLGHLCSSLLRGPTEVKPMIEFPVLTLSVSGGHTDIWLRTDHVHGKLLGTTRDDAAGEAFDKGAVLLGLPYPGGPEIEKLAALGDETVYKFPEPLQSSTSVEFSFSGLKTSLKYLLRDLKDISETDRKNIAASYQFAVIRHAVSRVKNALEANSDIKEIHVVGGVSANKRLQKEVETTAKRSEVACKFPSTLRYCTDNAAMIASAGYFLFEATSTETETFAVATLDLAKDMQQN